MSLSDDDMVAEYSPTGYSLNSRRLTLGLEEAVEENNHLIQDH